MAVKKNLGIGLDVLLTSMQGQQEPAAGRSVLNRAQLYFGKALEQDGRGNSFEAYYLYRQAIDLFNTGEHDITELSQIISRSCNNIAVILFESDQTENAISFLQRAIDIYPQNRTALENMKAVRKKP